MNINKIKAIIKLGGFHRYFTNTAWLFLEQVFRLIAGVFVGIYVARYLGPEKFGIFSYVLVFVGIFGIISKLGLDSIIVRSLVNYSNRADLYLGTAFWLKFAAGILTLGVIGIAVQVIPNDLKTNLYIFIIASGLLFQQFEVVDFYFQSKALSKYVAVLKIIQLVISCILKFYLIFIHAGLFWFFLASLVDQVLLALSYVFVAWQQRIGIFFKQFKFPMAKEMLSDSWPLLCSGIAIMVYMRIDQIMIKEMLGVKQVGLYSAAVRISESWYFVPSTIATSLFPAILNAKQKSEELYLSMLRQLYNLMAKMAFIVAILMTFFSRFIITLLYGQEFEGASDVLAVHIWTGVFVALGAVRGKWLVSENLQIMSAKTMSIGALMNIALNIVLIPRYGIIGAAIGTVISYVFAVYFSLFFYKNTRDHFYLLSRVLNPVRLCLIS